MGVLIVMVDISKADVTMNRITYIHTHVPLLLEWFCG